MKQIISKLKKCLCLTLSIFLLTTNIQVFGQIFGGADIFKEEPLTIDAFKKQFVDLNVIAQETEGKINDILDLELNHIACFTDEPINLKVEIEKLRWMTKRIKELNSSYADLIKQEYICTYNKNVVLYGDDYISRVSNRYTISQSLDMVTTRNKIVWMKIEEINNEITKAIKKGIKDRQKRVCPLLLRLRQFLCIDKIYIRIPVTATAKTRPNRLLNTQKA